MKFEEFSLTLEKLEKESSRNVIIITLALLLEKMTPSEAKMAVYLLLGRTAPIYIPIEFGFSTKQLLKALAMLKGVGMKEIEDEYKREGDFGNLAYNYNYRQQHNILTLEEVFISLSKLARLSGNKSKAEKSKMYLDLLSKATKIEAKYITRIITGKLRLGLSLKSIFDTLSTLIKGDKSIKKEIEFAYGVRADIGLITEKLVENGIDGIRGFKAIAGVPITSKLVEREKDAKGVINRLGECLVQPKFDGLRTQIHYNKMGFEENREYIDNYQNEIFSNKEVEKVRIFSRNLESLTYMMPDIVDEIKKLPVESIILDSESVSYNEKTGEYLSFQETIRRKRKYNIEELVESHPLKVNIFDVVYLNGIDLTQKPLKERIDIIDELFKGFQSNIIVKAKNNIVNTEDDLNIIFNNYVNKGLEGIIAKDIESKYDPGTRNFDWIKLKASIKKDMLDTVDAVVMGYYSGSGLRTKFGIGAILIGVYNSDEDKYISLTKVGTGITDQMFKDIKIKLDEYVINEIPEYYSIPDTLIPDILIEPKIVVSVSADSISKSSLEKGCGYSLRFPRLNDFDRDKNPIDSTTIEELKRMYELKAKL